LWEIQNERLREAAPENQKKAANKKNQNLGVGEGKQKREEKPAKDPSMRA